MQLKQYQLDTLEALDRYVQALAQARVAEANQRAALEALDDATRAPLLAVLPDPPVVAWAALQQAGQTASPDPWRDLPDGHGRQTPHVCLELPTGSGKTLIAGHAVGRILSGLNGASTGFVLWLVPSDAIYQQTRAQLRDRGHPIRQALEIASGGRLKLLEKGSDFSRADVEDGLTVMLLMLQSARLPRENSEQKALKVFRESGRYASFYPEGDDLTAAQALKARVPNLETHDLLSGEPGAIVQSLGNTLKLIRPVIVLDEGHTAYSVERRRLLGQFNPRFLVELTATPGRELSNILVKIGGQRLRDAEMIKLPIELVADNQVPWQDTLQAALEQRARLERLALDHEATSGRYIRPIMLVRVEVTGREQRDKGRIHTEDAVDALIGMGVPPEWIRRQTAIDKELDDQLLSDTSPVRIIITRDALREGWDCPFAYVLTLLTKSRAKTALTQMIGRVLRQPGARRTGVPELDSAWVFCTDTTVKDAVEGVRNGLSEEGMADLRLQVRSQGLAEAETRTVGRRPQWAGSRVLVPTVTHADDKGGVRLLDFDRDILAEVDWSALLYEGGADLVLDEPGARRARRSVDYTNGQLAAGAASPTQRLAGEIDRPDLARRLLGLVPNPWVAMTFVDQAIAALRGRGLGDVEIGRGRLDIVSSIRVELGGKVEAAARAIFMTKLDAGIIAFRLTGSAVDWEMPLTFETSFRPRVDRWLTDDHGDKVGRTLFVDGVKDGELNGFETDVALYLDGKDALAWWWRLTSRGAWGLQGWRRNRIYPDFLVRFAGDGRNLMVLETKGKQLDNDDTRFKRELMDALQAAYRQPITGEVELFDEAPDSVRFTMLLQDEDWKTSLAGALAP
ncbi:DEAD/DEAH box helicase [Brevundimonas mediterranea]|uniref:Type III restriction enzyme n=1 Tax=Brevundimonas mediterranea TaxID=74329 RepID=A0A7W6F0E9_9CAUL|nr:DEAD/DEAH box helicase family protein [Brevundimonas mediterranea]MBB3872920.1 type III restriction enzyme [Brevundimonas mediterranea]